MVQAKTVLVTGANRGIGLGLVQGYADAGWRALAGCRRPDGARELQALAAGSAGRVEVFQLDVTDDGDIAAMRRRFAGQPIDIVINNAGRRGPRGDTIGDCDESEWVEMFRVNTIAPLRISEALLDNIALGERKLLAFLTSKMGSMAENRHGHDYAYRASKAALNAVVRSIAIDLRAQGITAVAVHPGWVKTEMGGPGAPLGIAESAAALRALFESLTIANSGSLISYDGSRIPW